MLDERDLLYVVFHLNNLTVKIFKVKKWCYLMTNISRITLYKKDIVTGDESCGQVNVDQSLCLLSLFSICALINDL